VISPVDCHGASAPCNDIGVMQPKKAI